MAQTLRYALLAGLTVALVAMLLGCTHAVTGQNVMPDNPNLSPAQQRQAMIKWHQQHDKPAAGATPSGGQ
ncbi:MAG TPA: hypothetical protein VFA07_10990 [Chthonomonadaceae bacterium]|nr:hypothetical protein [Chthonomonadaceae bacterium]